MSLFNAVQIADGVGISVSWYRTSPSPSHHSGDHGRSSGFYSYGDNRSGHMYHTSQFSAYNHGGINISHPRFPQEGIPRCVHGEIYIKIILIVFIPKCQHTLIQSCHQIIINTCHHIFFQALHHTKFVCVHIALLLLCMYLMQFHTIRIYHP